MPRVCVTEEDKELQVKKTKRKTYKYINKRNESKIKKRREKKEEKKERRKERRKERKKEKKTASLFPPHTPADAAINFVNNCSRENTIPTSTWYSLTYPRAAILLLAVQ